MAKLFDYISLTIITFLLTFVWTALAFDSALPALIMSCTITLIAVVTLRYIRQKTGKPYTYDRLALEFGIRGNEYVISLLKSALKNPDICAGSNYILLEKSILIANFKFSALNISDIGAACACAKKYCRKQVFLICRTIDRKAYAVAQLEGVRLNPVHIRAVYKLLKKYGALPDLAPIKEKPSLKRFVRVALNRANFKAYAFSGAALILTSFITPLKIYYLTFGSVALVLAALTLTPLGNGSYSAPKMCDEFEKAVMSMPDQICIEELEN